MIKAIKKQHYRVVIALFLCMVGACKKQPSTTAISADLEKNFSYKPGTYWIYRDSLNGEIDSFSVTYNEHFTTSSNNGNYDQESDDIIVYYFGTIKDTFGMQWELQYNYISINYAAPNSLSNNKLIYDKLFEYPFNKYEVYQTYNLGSNAFNNVAKIITGPSNLVSPSPDIFYITADAGIVKMRLNDPADFVNRVWELQRYKIVH